MRLPRDRRSWLRIVAVVAAVVGLYILYREFFPELDLQQALADVSEALGAWTYALVGIFAFLETGAFVGLIAPGETAVVLGGAVAGQGETLILVTIGIVWLGAFLGDSVSFLLGVRLGRGFVYRHGPRFKITPERYSQVETYFENHGGKTILIGRFIGIIRALAPFIAGSSGMRYSAMVPYSILGTGLWATFFSLLGFYASQNLDAVVHAAEQGFFYFGVIVALIVGTIVAANYLKHAENRARVVAEFERRRILRPLVDLGRRLRPQALFLWNRLTPGNLGIELTAPLAVLAVGSFVFISYALIVGDDPGPTPADTTAADVAESLRVGWLTSVEKAVTVLGSSAALLVVGAAASVWLAAAGRRQELGTLLFSIVVLLISVSEFKELIDRPRPEGGLVSAGGQSYPSGHAAYSVVYSYLAVIAAVALRPRWSGATALLIGGILLTVVIGLSRVYLGVHYLSDVSGGWALGASVFAIGTIIAVIVTHFRQNRGSGA